MIRNKTFIIGLFLLVAGTGIILYPHILQKKYEYDADKIVREFDAKNKNILLPDVPEDTADVSESNTYDQLYWDMVDYNQKLYESGQEDLRDPYAYENSDFNLKDYGIEDGIVGYIEIDKMGIKLPIFLGANKENMKNGAAHLTKTSMPVGGNNTNTVIAAHRGYSYAAMFRNIEDLKIGDEVVLTNYWETLTYKVAETKVILPTEIREIFIQENRELLTLITCHPYRHNYQRYVVYCERVS